MYFFQFLIISMSFISQVASSDDKNYFISPSSNNGINPTLKLGEATEISWKTTLEVFNVSIWQQSLVEQGASSQGNIFAKIHPEDDVSNFTWVVQLYGFDFSYSNVFFFWINPDGPNGFVSTYFNITQPDSSTSTIQPSNSTSSNNSTNTSSAPTPTLTSNHSSNSDLQSTQTEKVAIGVACGIGIPILCALGVLVWLKARQNSSQQKNHPIPSQVAQPWPNECYQCHRPTSAKEVHGASLPVFHELPTLGHR